MRRVCTISALVLVLIFGGVFTAWADTEEAEPAGLSLEQAIEKAMRHSVMVKQAELDVDRAQEVADAAWDAHNWVLQLTYDDVDDVYKNIPGTGDSWLQSIATDRQWHLSKASLSMTRDAVVLMAKQAYYDVLKQQTAVERAVAAEEKAARDLRTVNVMANVGMAVGVQTDGAKAALEGARSELEKARGDYEGAYRELNKLIGLRPEERPALSTGIEFDPLEVPSVDAAVTRALSVDYNPMLWSVREGYELSRYTWTTAQTDKAGRIDIDKAWYSYEDARATTRNIVHKLYDMLKTLEAAHESATAGVAAAEEALRIAELKYQLGMITRTDMLDAQVKLAQAQEGLYEIRILYALTKEQFLKPWLASAGAAAGGQGAAQGAGMP